MHKRGYSRHAVSVHTSVTFVDHVKTNKHIFEFFSPSGSCVPNLKSLASTVAEINRGSQIFSFAPLAQTPPILVLNVVFC